MLQCKTKWKKSILSNLSTLKKGVQVNGDLLSEKGLFPVINGGIEPSGYYDKYNREPNTITISEGGNSCGFVNYMNVPFWSGGHCYTLADVKDIDVKYLYHFLKFQEHNIMKLRLGSGLPNIQRKDIENFKIIFIEEDNDQQKIADILSTCDEVIEKTEETIEKYKQIKAGMMQDLFTRGLDENGKLRPIYEQSPDLYKYAEELDRYIPKEWDVKRLDEVSTILSGKDYKGNPKGNCNVPIYGTGGVMGYTTIPLYYGPAVLTGRKGSINNPYYVEGDFWNVDTIFCLKMLDDNDALWFYYQIYITDMMKYNEATGVPSTTSKTLNKILFAVPKSPEQTKIAQSIIKFDKKIEIEEQYLNKYKQIKQGLMKRLLTPPADAEIVEE